MNTAPGNRDIKKERQREDDVSFVFGRFTSTMVVETRKLLNECDLL